MLLKKIFLILLVSVITVSFNLVDAQIPDQPDAEVAGIPVNYTEAKVGPLNLPDVLTTFDDKPVAGAKTWNEVRRPELLKYIETEYYGRIPETAPKVTWVVDSIDSNAFGGKAIMKKLAGHMGTPDGPAIDVTLYTPANAREPVPFSFWSLAAASPPVMPMTAQRTPGKVRRIKGVKRGESSPERTMLALSQRNCERFCRAVRKSRPAARSLRAIPTAS